MFQILTECVPEQNFNKPHLLNAVFTTKASMLVAFICILLVSQWVYISEQFLLGCHKYILYIKQVKIYSFYN